MKNILVVATDDKDRSLLRTLLEKYSEQHDEWFSIYEVSNSEEAFKATKIYNFDFVFIDIIRPFMDHIDTRKFIHDNNSNAVALISAINDDTEPSIFNNGASIYLRKPINMTELKQCLDSLI